MKKYRIGVDVGGTNVKLALVDLNGKIVYSNTTPTRADLGYEHSIANIQNAIEELMRETNTSKDNVEAIGFGFPGQIDYKEGVVRLLTLICITVGTGIGSGLVFNGKLIRGSKNAAGEIGHIKLTMFDGPICGCGDWGCLEAYASGPSIVAEAKEYLKGGKSSKFKELATEELSPYIVAQAALQGDAVAKRIYTKMGEIIGFGLSSVVNLLNPEKIIIGGGVADAGEILLNPIRETISKRAMPIQANSVEIVPAQLGNTAGVIGASLLIES